MLVFAPSGGPEEYAGARIRGVPGIPFPPYPQVRLSPAHPGVGRDLRRFKPEVIHVVNPAVLGPGGVYYAWRMKVPLVASYHTNIATYAPHYKLSFLIGLTRSATRFMHNQAQINLCTSEATRKYLSSEGIERLRLWPQGVDARRFHPDKASKEWRIRLSGGHPAEKVLLFVGRLAPEKGIERLKVIVERVPGVRLAIVGDGPVRKELESEFRGTPTVFTGFLHGGELARAYASADVFLFPSTTDTLGMAMLEAMASGLPVVAARSGASREVVDAGKNGLLYEANSGEALADAIHTLFADDVFYENLSRGARTAAEERDWKSSTETLRSYYEEAKNGR